MNNERNPDQPISEWTTLNWANSLFWTENASQSPQVQVLGWKGSFHGYNRFSFNEI